MLCGCCTPQMLMCGPLCLPPRFTVVTRTKYTSLPTGADKYRLAAVKPLLSHVSVTLIFEDFFFAVINQSYFLHTAIF